MDSLFTLEKTALVYECIYVSIRNTRTDEAHLPFRSLSPPQWHTLVSAEIIGQAHWHIDTTLHRLGPISQAQQQHQQQ